MYRYQHGFESDPLLFQHSRVYPSPLNILNSYKNIKFSHWQSRSQNVVHALLFLGPHTVYAALEHLSLSERLAQSAGALLLEVSIVRDIMEHRTGAHLLYL